MKLKPKTRNRLLLVAAAFTVVVIGGVGALFIRQTRLNNWIEERRTEGLAAYDKGDYQKAMENLGQYAKRRPSDADALRKLATARFNVKSADGAHIGGAFAFLQQYLTLRPDDTEALLEMLRHGLTARLFPEVRDIASRTRSEGRFPPGGKEDIALLRIEVDARRSLLAAQGNTASSADSEVFLRLFTDLAKALPLDSAVQLPYVAYLRSVGRNNDAVTWAQELLKDHPNDPRPRLINLIATLNESSAQSQIAVTEELATMAGLTSGRFSIPQRTSRITFPDKDFVAAMVSMFDSLGMPDHALDVLIQANQQKLDPELSSIVIRRIWQSNRADLGPELNNLLNALDVNDRNTDPAALAIKAMLLQETGKPDDAKALVDNLKARPDFRAQAWAIALPWVFNPDRGATTDAVADLRKAVRDHRGEPMLHYLLGQRLASLGRVDEAIAAWKDAASFRWSRAEISLAQTYLGMGMLEEASGAVIRAVLLAPTDPNANFLLLINNTARAEAGLPLILPAVSRDARARLTLQDEYKLAADGAERIAEQFKTVPQRWANPQYVEFHRNRVRMQLVVNNTDKAKAIIQEALDADIPLAQRSALFVSLAAISKSRNLGLEDRLLAAADAANVAAGSGSGPENAGSAKPAASTTAARAAILASQGQRAEAVALLRKAIDDAPQENKLARTLDLARHLDTTAQSPEQLTEARSVWNQLADAHPDDPAVQSQVALARTMASDLAGVDKAIGRWIAATGADPQKPEAGLRLARARAMLAGELTPRQRDDAVAIIRGVLQDQPGLTDANRLLVAALTASAPMRGIEPRYGEAADTLRALLPAAPSPAEIHIQIAQLRREQGDLTEARRELDLAAGVTKPAPTPDLQLRIAEQFLLQGDFQQARPLLQQARSAPDAPKPVVRRAAIHLAEIDLAEARPAPAISLLREALPDADAEQSARIGILAHRAKDAALADAAAERLGTLELPSAERARLLSRLQIFRGQRDQAIATLRQAILQNPADRSLHLTLCDAFINQGDRDNAAKAAQDGLKALPDDPDLRVISAVIATGDFNASSNLKPLIDALRAHPTRAREAAGIQAIADLIAAGKIVDRKDADGRITGVQDDPASLIKLTKDFPDQAQVQLFAIPRLLALGGPPQVTEALALAERAAARFSVEPAFARMAVRAAASLRDWERLRTAARELSKRSFGTDPEAAAADAQASLNLNQFQGIRETLAPHLESARATPDNPVSLTIIDTLARTLVLTDRSPASNGRDAAALLRGFLTHPNRGYISVWLTIAAQVAPNPRPWLDEARPALRADVPQEARDWAVATAIAGERLTSQAAAGAEGPALVAVAAAALDALPQTFAQTDPQTLSTRATIAELQLDWKTAADRLRAILPVLARLQTEFPQQATAFADESVAIRIRLAAALVRVPGAAQEALTIAEELAASGRPNTKGRGLSIAAMARIALLAAQSDPNTPAAKAHRDALSELKENMVTAARQDATAIRTPGLPVELALNVAGFAEREARQHAVAAEWYGYVMTLQETSPALLRPIRNNRAMAIARANPTNRAQIQSQIDEVLGLIQRPEPNDPYIVNYRGTIGRLYRLVDMHADAVRYLEQSLAAARSDLSPDQAQSAVLLADSLLALSPPNTQRAAELLQLIDSSIAKGVKLQPDDQTLLDSVRARLAR